MKSLTAALALCLPLTALAQSADKTSEAKTPPAQPGDSKSSQDKGSQSATDAGLKKGHKMQPHASGAPAAPKAASDATVK